MTCLAIVFGMVFHKSEILMSSWLENTTSSDFMHAKILLSPKISGFGAVDDVGKRPISLWHKQTPGILGVDFYPDRLYNIL